MALLAAVSPLATQEVCQSPYRPRGGPVLLVAYAAPAPLQYNRPATICNLLYSSVVVCILQYYRLVVLHDSRLWALY